MPEATLPILGTSCGMHDRKILSVARRNLRQAKVDPRPAPAKLMGGTSFGVFTAARAVQIASANLVRIWQFCASACGSGMLT